MSPSAKFNSVLITITVFAIFYGVNYFSHYLTARGPEWAPLYAVGSLLTSLAVYRFLSLLVRAMMARSQLLARMLLGRHYMEGTWVGVSESSSGERRFLVEHHKQDFDSLSIRGVSALHGQKDLGTWRSNAVKLDVPNGLLLFTYEFDRVSLSQPIVGIHSSALEFESRNGPPRALFGFAHDLSASERMGVHYEKLGPKFIPFCVALEEAEARFSTRVCAKQLGSNGSADVTGAVDVQRCTGQVTRAPSS